MLEKLYSRIVNPEWFNLVLNIGGPGLAAGGQTRLDSRGLACAARLRLNRSGSFDLGLRQPDQFGSGRVQPDSAGLVHCQIRSGVGLGQTLSDPLAVVRARSDPVCSVKYCQGAR